MPASPSRIKIKKINFRFHINESLAPFIMRMSVHPAEMWAARGNFLCGSRKVTHGTKKQESTGIASNRWRYVMTSLTAHGAVATSFLFLTAVCLTSCASVSHHQFSEPAAGWQTQTGQLMYRTAKTTLIGEAVVRFSKSGDFELTVSKGPGITLLSLRQDAAFAEFNANFTGQRWSGPIAQAPLSCAAGSGCAINSFAHQIKRRCDTSAAARHFYSGSKQPDFSAVTM